MQWLIDLVLESLTGIIVMWHGFLADIPDGWAVCDGNNGTPDLEGRFVKSAEYDATVNTIGGTANHSHPVTGYGHVHDFGAGPGGYADGSKDRDDNTESAEISGITFVRNHEPPFYRLFFIMKLPPGA